MKKIFTFFLGLLLSLTAQANDSMYFTIGNQLVPVHSKDISIKREVLTITILNEEEAKVDVFYELHNAGKAQTVVVGFEADPGYNAGYGINLKGIHEGISNFKAVVNDRPVSISNAVVQLGELEKGNGIRPIDMNKWKIGESDFTNDGRFFDEKTNEVLHHAYAYYFTADFVPGKNTIHHTYSYKLGCSTANAWFLDYKLTPAARWAGGKIEDFTLYLIADKNPLHCYIRDFADVPLHYTINGQGKQRKGKSTFYTDEAEEYDEGTELSVRNATICLNLKNYHPTQDLYITSADYICNYTNEQGLPPYFSPNGRNLYAFGIAKDSDFGGLPKERVMRNLPYAYRGYVFKNPQIAAYFNKLWWYLPDPSYTPSDTDFTEYEQALITGKTDEFWNAE